MVCPAPSRVSLPAWLLTKARRLHNKVEIPTNIFCRVETWRWRHQPWFCFLPGKQFFPTALFPNVREIHMATQPQAWAG